MCLILKNWQQTPVIMTIIYKNDAKPTKSKKLPGEGSFFANQ